MSNRSLVANAELISDAPGQHLALRYDRTNAVGRWDVTALPAGQMLRPPTTFCQAG
ncbi:MAG: hypothetical protein R2932_58500 [Caldilineaceae bacterium]